MEKGEISAEIPAPGVETEVFFAEKGLALRWLDEDAAEDGWQYENVWKRYTTCCRLEPDGTLGESMPADGEGGRRLIGGRLQMAHFAGEEVLKTMQYDRLKVETFTQLRRVSDNALILDAPKETSAGWNALMEICPRKDGCL